MALILPRNYHKITAVERNRISWIEPEQAERQDIRPLRIGILNIMPLGKQYEFNLLHPLGLSVLQIEPIWIRLQSHAYRSWDQAHLNHHYVSWEEAQSQRPLDGLIMFAMTSDLFYARCCLFNVATAYGSDPTAVDHLGLGLQVTNRLSATQVASACSKSALMSSMCSNPTDTRTMVGVTPAEACSSALSC